MSRPSRHGAETRAVAEAMLRETDLTMAEIAFRVGVPYSSVEYWNKHGPGRQGRVSRTTGRARDLATLDAALRRHIARQIAAFDLRLRAEDAALDSAKVLRDVGGLKRLLDDLYERRPPLPHKAASPASAEEIGALREELVRRYEGFEVDSIDSMSG